MRGHVVHTRRIVSCLALSITLLVYDEACAERFVEYLHIEAGSGASGGGHAALRIGDTTYHYVYDEPGIIRASAEPNEEFDYAYRALGNRNIHVSRILTDDATYDALADAFDRRQLTQSAQLALLATAERDGALVDTLRTRYCAAAGFTLGNEQGPRLRGAGYFDFAGPSTPATDATRTSAESNPLLGTSGVAELRADIDRAYGPRYLANTARGIERELRQLAFSPISEPRIVEGTIPTSTESFADRTEALLAASAALDVLTQERPPIPGAFRSVDAPAQRLSEQELGVLAARAVSLRSSLVRLAASRRRDWGYPMLVGMARLVALDASLRSGRLVVPDAFDTVASSVPVERLLSDRPVVDALIGERRADLATTRAELFAAPPVNEVAWSRLEVAAAAMLELDDAFTRGHGAVRGYSETMLPSRSLALDATWPLPVADCDTLARWAVSASDAVESLRSQLRVVYWYDVITRNCVTELFRTIETAGVTFGSRERIDSGLGFVPFVAADAVNAKYPVVKRSILPSYRTYWLRRLDETEGRARTALLESNTITATLRHPDDDDDVFLFYTDNATVLRPLYGVINAGVGAGASIAGLATLPFDRGRLLFTGVRSFAFSVPEIAFVNFRKGRNGILPRAWM